MAVELTAEIDLHPGQINLFYTWTAPGPRPDLRLARRQLSYPANPSDGFPALALGDWFAPSGTPRAKLSAARYVLSNVLLEGGLLQAEVDYFYAGPNDSAPAQARVWIFDLASQAVKEFPIGDVSRLAQSSAVTPPWARVDTLEIFAKPGGGAEVSAGVLTVSTHNSNPAVLDQVAWTPQGGAAITVPFDQVQQQDTLLNVQISRPDALRIQASPPGSGAASGGILLDETFNQDIGEWSRRLQVSDTGLLPETIYYYTLFSPDPANPGQWLSGPDQRAFALTGADHNLSQRLYQLLPEVHRRYDEPDPANRGNGELRHFLQIFGAGLDQVRSLAEGLRTRHDLAAVRPDALPALAQWIGWDPDQTLPVQTQRSDIHQAPLIFETVGTLPNIRALINRATGWDCQIKEFANNVFLTNSPEAVAPWDLLGQTLTAGQSWTAPATLSQSDGFEGRPTGVTVPGAKDYLFFHSSRGQRREIWQMRLDVANSPPKRVAQGLPDDDPAATYHDENPAALTDATNSLVWLFWDSDRDGQHEIYARSYKVQMSGSFLRGQDLLRLTNHPAEDRFPTAVMFQPGHYWVFWQSNRRGPTDIWGMQGDGTTWGLPQRITTAVFRDEAPAAVVDGSGRVWLFWCADLGDRRNLWVQVFDGTWGAPQALTSGLWRDEAPAAAFWNNQIWLFWQTNANGRWQIMTQVHDGANWQPASVIASSPADDKEPGVTVDSAGRLNLFWRSQRRPIQFRSRTVDFDDPQMLQSIGKLADYLHYSYDTDKGSNDWYARDTVGLYLKPDIADPNEIARRIEQVQAFVEPFRPLPVRLLWMTL